MTTATDAGEVVSIDDYRTVLGDDRYEVASIRGVAYVWEVYASATTSTVFAVCVAEGRDVVPVEFRRFDGETMPDAYEKALAYAAADVVAAIRNEIVR